MRRPVFAALALMVAVPASAQFVINVARDSGRLIGMGEVCGGDAATLANRHRQTMRKFVAQGVNDLFREDARRTLGDAIELGAASQQSGRGFGCPEVTVLLRQAERDLANYFQQLGIK